MKIRGAVLEEIGRTRPFAESAPISISELDLDEPGEGEILVQIEAAGLCHSDLSVVDGNRVRPVPMLLGHEAAGRITQLGAGVDDVTVGQRVVMTFLPRCGECEGCATDGRMPCVPGTGANNDGTLLDGERDCTAAATPCTTTSGCPDSQRTRSSTAARSFPSATTSPPMWRPCSDAPSSPAEVPSSTRAIRNPARP